MDIALATTSINKWGGASSFQNHLAAQLRELGHTVTQYHIGRTDAHLGRVICVDRSVVKRPDEPFVAPERLTCEWRALWDRHDVVHITNPGALHIGFDHDQLFGTKHGPLVLTVHDPHEIEVIGPTLLKLCELADRVTFIGGRYMRHFVDAGYVQGFADKARLVPQPYVRRAPADKDWTKARVAVCTSPWRPVKRIDLIVKAAGLLPVTRETERAVSVAPLRFWAGVGVDYVEDIVEALDGYKNCDDMGSWPEFETDIVYGPARVLVNMTHFDETDTGRTEYPILEAWDYQVLPVLPSDFAGDPGPPSEQAFRDGVNCVIVEPEPEAIAEGIMRAMDLHLPWSWYDASLEPHLTAGRAYVTVYSEAMYVGGEI